MSTSRVNQTFPLFPTSVMMHHAIILQITAKELITSS